MWCSRAPRRGSTTGVGADEVSRPLVGLSLMPEADYAAAALPLLSAGVVDAVEYSFDMRWGSGPPEWMAGLLDHYGQAGRLLGHGVSWSMLSARWSDRHEAWLRRLGHEVAERRYAHVSEHFGFMLAADFTWSAPLPVPATPSVVRMGRERLQRLAKVAGVPVGLENLALALSADDALGQGALLDAMLEAVDGFVLLDVHNLWCQVANFGLDPADLLARFPLHRVRQIHVSGGSWDVALQPRFRRDTHDDAVPDEVLELLALALPRCAQLEHVVLERLGTTLPTAAAQAELQRDFHRVREVCGA